MRMQASRLFWVTLPLVCAVIAAIVGSDRLSIGSGVGLPRDTDSENSRINDRVAHESGSKISSNARYPTVTGESYGTYLADRHMDPERLHSELEALKMRLPDKAFFKVMEMIGGSGYYSPVEKAEAFNRFLPYKEGPRVVPVYNEVLLDWGVLDGNEEQFFQFVEELESSEIQEILATGYAKITFESLAELRDMIVDLADLEKPSYVGDSVGLRAMRIGSVVNSMSQGKHITVEEARTMVEEMDIDQKFKELILADLESW